MTTSNDLTEPRQSFHSLEKISTIQSKILLSHPSYKNIAPEDLLRSIIISKPSRRIDLDSIVSHHWVTGQARCDGDVCEEEESEGKSFGHTDTNMARRRNQINISCFLRPFFCGRVESKDSTSQSCFESDVLQFSE
jgi:hypothetical protein